MDYIAVDWGTTNRRAWHIGPGSHVIAEYEDDLGLMAVPAGGFDAAVADLRQQLGDYSMLLAGMVGSDMGWRNAGYVACPADAKSLAKSVLWVEQGRTAIVPGVRQDDGHADVMRGEEVQVFGAQSIAGLPPQSLICHPGTHTKWIRLADGKISRFHTAMTGEIFNLLKSQSILAHQMTGEVSDNDAFQTGVKDALDGVSLLSGLFAVRARYLLQSIPIADASYASGLLIGSDVADGLKQHGDASHITVVGRPDLSMLYASAIGAAGCTSVQIDGSEAFRAGIGSIISHFGTE